MKKVLYLLFVLLVSFCAHSQTCPTGLNGVVKIGPTGTYRTLSAALDTLRVRGLSGPVTLELQAAYTSVGEVFPIYLSGIGCLSAAQPLVIRPEAGASNLAITSASVSTLSFDNARYVTVDGRPGGSGTSALRIANTSTSGSAVRFLNDASFNALRHLTVQSVNATPQGHIYFGTSNQSITNGNSYNEISNCVLKNDNNYGYLSAIYSLGSDNKKNRGNIVRNCEIINSNESAISLQRNSEAWQLEDNSFYGTPPSIASIHIDDTTSSGFVISGNYIGGTAPQCGGAAMQTRDYFVGMLLRTGSNGYTSVQNNTIANISHVSTNRYYFAGINLAMGKFRCGDEQGNTIGSRSGTNSIRFGMNAIHVLHFDLFGILAGDQASYTSSIDTTYIQNNVISAIYAYRVSGLGDGVISPIAVRNQKKGFIEISGNTVGNPAQFNSIQNAVDGGSVIGIDIQNNHTSNKNLVKNNLIANLSGSSTGIKVAQAGAHVIGNTIKGLYDTLYPDLGGAVYGIFLSNCLSGLTVSGNTIHTLSVHSQSPTVCGIRLTYANNILVEKNNIHSLQGTPTLSVAALTGIDVDYSGNERIQNNMIRLGVDTTGNPITGTPVLRGIHLSAPNSVVTHNSIYIGGNGTNESVALNCTSDPQTITNNILFNARSATGSSTYNHYALKYAGNFPEKLGLNYNIYYATGNQGYVAALLRNYSLTTATTIEQLRSLSKSDSNSMVYAPNFINPNGNVSSGDLHLANPNPAEGQGGADPLVTEDIDGQLRTAHSPTDIGADAGNFVLQDGDKPLLTHVPFVGQVLTEPHAYVVRITDNGGGVDITTSNKPRMWYRKKFPFTSAWVSVAGTLQSGTPSNGLWHFVADLSLTGTTFNAGDSAEYYFVAQDKGPLVNIGYSNSTGVLHSSVTAQTTPPTSPLRLLLMGYFPDTVYVGTGHTYTSLSSSGGFFEASNKMMFHPATPHPVVYITSDLLQETATYRYKNLSTERHTVRIQTPTPTIKQIKSASTTQTLLSLYQVQHLVIDGSVDGGGRYLKFTSGYSNGASSRPALGLSDSKNVTIQHCIFEGNITTSEAVVTLGASNSRALRFKNNLIRNIESGYGAGIPTNAMSVGIVDGDSIEITHNEVTNFGAVGLRVTQGVIAPTTKLLIDSNHFYYNSAIAPVGSRTAINHSTYNAPATITNNFIGGSAPYCQGAPWTFTTQVSGGDFRGITVDVSKDTISTVSRNTIRNIHFTNLGYTFYGISVGGNSSANLEGNIIGDPATDSSIVNKQTNYGIWGYVARYSGYRPQLLINNNLVAGMTAPSLEGIHLETITALVQNNRITRLRTSGNSFSPPGYKGLNIWLEGGTISGNEISDLISYNSTQGSNYGIDVIAYGPLPNEVVVERNKIARLQTVGSGRLIGLNINNGQLKVLNNTISLTNGPTASAATLYGMLFTGSAANVFQLPVQYNTVYIGGESNSTAKSAAVYVEGGSPIASFRNNLLYNERSGSGQHLALGVLPASGASAWTKPNTANHNVYVAKDTGAINEWTTKGIMGLPLWQSIARGDSASYSNTTSQLPSGSFFIDAAAGDLHINPQDPMCWQVNGKGIPLPGVSADIDSATGARSVSLVTGATDIGADEFSTSSQPPALMVTGKHEPNGVDTLWHFNKVVATIQWGSAGTLPELGAARLYSGTWPNDTTNNGTTYAARPFNAYWHIPASGGSNYSYSLTLYYDSAMLGAIRDLSTMVLNKRQSGVPGSWTEIHPTLVNIQARTLTVVNQTSFSEFTATDSLATLASGVAAPDLVLSTQSIAPLSIAAGSNFTATFTESNRGNAAAGSRQLHYYLSADDQLTPGANGDTLLGRYDLPDSLAPNSNTGALSKELFMPCSVAPGNYYLFFTADAARQVAEMSEVNNIAAVAVTIASGGVLSVPTITAAPQPVVCSASPVTLTAALNDCTGCTVAWSTGAATPSITVNNSGLYSVTVSNVCGSLSDSQEVVIHPLAALSATISRDTVCLGNSVTLTASGGQSYAWSGQGLQASSGNTVTARPTASGTVSYVLTGTSQGCTQTDTLHLVVQALPVLSVQPGDTLICSGSSVALTASGATGFSWSPATGLSTTTGASVVATPTATTTYLVSGTTNGCSSTTSYTLSVAPVVTPSVSISHAGCAGSNLVFTATPVNGGSNPRYQWYVNNTPQGTGSSLALNGATNGTGVYVSMTPDVLCASPQQVNSSTITVNCTTTAVPTIDALESFVIAPNPSKGVVSVQMKLKSAKKLLFKVLDASGSVIYESTPATATGSTVRKIDLSGKAAGVYYLITVIGSEQFIEKIIIAR